ncbi:MAG: hypothetical protein ACP5UV_06370, partial [Thermoplasmata archaeon]
KDYSLNNKLRRKGPIRIDFETTELKFNENKISVRTELAISKVKHDLLYYRSAGIFYGTHFNLYIKEFPYSAIIISKLAGYIMDNLIDFYISNIRSAISDISGLNGVKLIPYGRNILVQLFNSSLKIERYAMNDTLDVLNNLQNAPFSSYFKWLDAGRVNLKTTDPQILSFFEFIMQGKIEDKTEEGGLIYKYSEEGEVSINLSSAMIEEVTGIMLPVISSKPGELIIIEEPEAQLHISTQILIGILLIYITTKLNVKIIFSTHSDIMALVMQYIISNKVDNNAIKELMQKIYKMNSVDIPSMELNSEMAKEINFYYIKNETSMLVNENEMRSNVPGITDTMTELFDWMINSLKNKDKQ